MKGQLKMRIINRKSTLVLTKEEKNTLQNAAIIIDKLAKLTDRATSVDWSMYDDDEMWGVVDFINDLLQNAIEGN